MAFGDKFKRPKNLIPICILGVGLIIAISVGVFAYRSLSGDGGEHVQKSDIEAFRKDGGTARRENRQSKKETYKRQKEITEKELAGVWETSFKKGVGLIEMKKGQYRLVIIPNRQSVLRYYSNGSYKIEDDVVFLQPDLNIPPPKSDVYRYEILTRGRFLVSALTYKGKLIWQSPPSDLRTYVPPYNPVLDRGVDDIVIWRPLKS